MNIIRYISAGILMALAAVNFYLGFKTSPGESFIMFFLFSLIYFFGGLLVTGKTRFTPFIGIILPVTILIIYPLLVNFTHFTPWSAGFMSACNVIVVIGSFFLLLMNLTTK